MNNKPITIDFLMDRLPRKHRIRIRKLLQPGALHVRGCNIGDAEAGSGVEQALYRGGFCDGVGGGVGQAGRNDADIQMN